MGNKIVYKYRNWGNQLHRSVLCDNQLYLSSPSDFNDPFDCKIPTNYYLLDTPGKIVNYANSFIKHHRQDLIAQGIDLNAKRNEIIDGLTNDKQYIHEKNADSEFRHNAEHIGVLSLTYRWDSILMWSHYSDNHRGFCIGFDREKLIVSNLFGKGGDVEYVKKFPNINPVWKGMKKLIKNSFIRTHHKALDWKYEKEYRLTKTFYPNIPSPGERIVAFPDDFISEILLGMDISDTHKQEIIALATAKGIKVYQTMKIPFEFRLGKQQVT